MAPRVSTVRVHGPAGSAQFAVQLPADDVERGLDPHLAVTRGRARLWRGPA